MNDPTQWSTQAKVIGVAVLVAAAATGWYVLTSHGRTCSKLEEQYTDNWLKYGSGLAADTKRRAANIGCGWALQPQTDIMKHGQY